MYTPQEIRAIIYRCNNLAELHQVELHLLFERQLYSELAMGVFNEAIIKKTREFSLSKSQ